MKGNASVQMPRKYRVSLPKNTKGTMEAMNEKGTLASDLVHTHTHTHTLALEAIFGRPLMII
jgi:hypothetical protein